MQTQLGSRTDLEHVFRAWEFGAEPLNPFCKSTLKPLETLNPKPSTQPLQILKKPSPSPRSPHEHLAHKSRSTGSRLSVIGKRGPLRFAFIGLPVANNRSLRASSQDTTLNTPAGTLNPKPQNHQTPNPKRP